MFRGNSLQGITLTVLAVFLLKGCNSFKLAGQNSGSGTTPAYPNFVSCMYNSTTPMVENIPNPNDCTVFHSCHIQMGVDPDPTERHCPMGQDGSSLHYDFLTCRCQDKELATCYDDYDASHRQRFFICAYPYVGRQKHGQQTSA